MKSIRLIVVTTILFFLGINLAISQTTPSTSTEGTLTFTVKSITNNSTYSPKNVFAIWITDSMGTFVKSCKVMAASRKKHLVKWNASSVGNTVNAITGSTLSNHQTHTIEWDGTNVSGVTVPDGPYKVCVEYSSTNSANNGNAGPFLSVDFVKDANTLHLTPSNVTFYQNIVADWVPKSTIGVNKLEEAGARFQFFPNPVVNTLSILLSLSKKSQVSIELYDAKGRLQLSLLTDILNSGEHRYEWSPKQLKAGAISSGLYLLKANINGHSEIHKLIIQ